MRPNNQNVDIRVGLVAQPIRGCFLDSSVWGRKRRGWEQKKEQREEQSGGDPTHEHRVKYICAHVLRVPSELFDCGKCSQRAGRLY